MSNDESTILFPINQLKAETLRLVAKDLGVLGRGKKLELLERLRACCDSGWVTPNKRKLSPEDSKLESPPVEPKKSRTLRATPNASTTLVAPKRRTRRDGRRVRADSPKQELPINGEPTSAFIAGGDLLSIVDKIPILGVVVLWKGTTVLAECDRTLIERGDHWLIPAHLDGNIQNVAAFKEAYDDVLEEERVQLKLTKPSGNGEATADVDDTDPAVVPEKSTKRWFEVNISRDMREGALAVKLVQGTIEDGRIVQSKDAKEEGTFWLSEPTVAGQANSESLDDIVELLL